MQRSFRAIAGLVCLVMLSGGFFTGCAPRPGAQNDPPVVVGAQDVNKLPPDGSLHGNPPMIDPNQQTRWSYSGMPTPELSSKPNYLLKSYGCAKGSATMNNEAFGAFRDLVTEMKQRPNVRVAVIGFCDKEAEAVNAHNLGMNRAQAGRQFLIDQGIAKERIEAASFGSGMADSAMDDPIGQAHDRRVEAWLLTE